MGHTPLPYTRESAVEKAVGNDVGDLKSGGSMAKFEFCVSARANPRRYSTSNIRQRGRIIAAIINRYRRTSATLGQHRPNHVVEQCGIDFLIMFAAIFAKAGRRRRNGYSDRSRGFGFFEQVKETGSLIKVDPAPLQFRCQACCRAKGLEEGVRAGLVNRNGCQCHDTATDASRLVAVNLHGSDQPLQGYFRRISV
jgi:hypothetical protein